MYLINPLANEKREITAKEFEKYFPNLKNGATFYIEKRGEDYYIETTLEVEQLKKEILAFHEKEKEEKIKLAEKTQKKMVNHFQQLKIPGFDEEKSFKEKTLEQVLKRGSGIENGKFRIVKAYESGTGNFANFLKDEYGLGGAGLEELSYNSNSSGLNIEYENREDTSNNFKTLLKWEQVAKQISNLIDNKEYFTAQEKENYEIWLKSQATSSQLSDYYKNYLKYQEKYPDKIVLMRLGDFYEVLGENATKVAEKLDLTLTGRNVGLKERIPMVGYPYHVADKYTEILSKDFSIVVVDGTNIKEYARDMYKEKEEKILRQDFPKDFESDFIETFLDDIEMEKRTIEQDSEKSILRYEIEQEFLKLGGGKSGIYDTSDPKVLDFVLKFSEFINEDELYKRDANNSLVRTSFVEIQKKDKSTQVKPSLDLNNKNKKEKQMNNSVKLQGTLVEKPEIKTSEKGTVWTSVVLEVEQQYADKSRINNFKVTFFGEQAEKLAQMEKGETLSVKGRLNSTTYNNKTSLQVIGNVAEQDEKVSKNAVQLSGFIQNKSLDIKTGENGNKYLTLALSVKSDSDKAQEYQTLFVNAFGKCAERIAENYTRYDLIKIDGALELNGERLSVVAHRSELIKSGKEIITAGKTQNENVKEDGQAPKQSTNDKI